jgi:hypothetical protein
VADARRRSARARGALLAALAAAAVLLPLLLAGCGGSASSDPLVGYWVGAAKGQMVLVAIFKDGGTYKILANPNRPLGTPRKEGDALVVDTHVVVMRFVPAGADKLTIELSGASLKNGGTIALQRVDETKYADAATAYGVGIIRRGLAMWKAGGGKKYPPPSEVTPTGALGKMIAWPPNLFTSQPMQPGTAKGDYTYAQVRGGRAYSLVGHLSDGSTVGK